MAIGALFNVELLADGVDLTTRNNKVELGSDAEELDVTCFKPVNDPDSGWKEVIPGLRSTAIAAEGFWEAGDSSKVDDSMFAGHGSTHAVIACPVGSGVASTSYFSKFMRARYVFTGELGQAGKWTFAASGTWPLLRGPVLHPAATARTATGDGTAVEHIAVASGKTLYAAMCVKTVAGTNPTLDVVIESDASNDFSGSETTRITFDQATAIGGQVKTASGPITDTWYRVAYTVGGSDPSMNFVVAIGVF